jgi:demethylmenaquinone methyltransferase/2-methoxy-6-polyprenyl-1,4-benzoquinol methylase
MAFYLAVLCFQSKLRVYCPARTTPAGGPGIRAGAFGDNLSMTPSPTVGTGNPDTLAPHAPLPLYYNNEVEHQAFLRRIFDSTAADYDRIEAVLAFGTGPSYRRAALQQAGLAAGAEVLDVGIGTGLVAREALKIIGPTGRLTGVDPSAGMMEQVKLPGVELLRAWPRPCPAPTPAAIS